MNCGDPLSLSRAIAICLLVLHLGNPISQAHEGVHNRRPSQGTAKRQASTSDGDEYRRVFAALISQWPTPLRQELISHSWKEHQHIGQMPSALSDAKLRSDRATLLKALEGLLPSIHVDWNEASATLSQPSKPLTLCRSIASPLLVTVHNRTSADKLLLVGPKAPFESVTPAPRTVRVRSGSEMILLTSVLATADVQVQELALSIDDSTGQTRTLSVPVQISEPARIVGTVREDGKAIPARVTVVCSDGVCRYGGKYANKSTFTDKPIIYPPIGGWQKTSFFYTDGAFEVKVPPGKTHVSVERGFEYQRDSATLNAESEKVHLVDLESGPMIDLARLGWVSGDTHVHWVTNKWNVDEPLELLAVAQRAEGLRVANNLTLLQRYANQAFIKPSQAPMGGIAKFSDSHFHIHMGEEYRNEDLYGHLCFLNIDWLVQPIGTGSIIAGPDALDYPLNRTAIEACRQQGGVSIEAHGTGGNKDVPVNVIYNLTDSLDQMEPEKYYRLLDCGFRLPLTNGSDHPARTLGIARAYVKVDGDFNYARWIDGIRRGRTFTSSGPLIFLKVNGSDIGDMITAAPTDALKITASVLSRDPIGTFAIVSNGRVIARKQTDELRAELNVTIPAEESRWIVARCSNRTDGRADFGFGNFNAITGTGVAHTSPVYVEVDGRPRFDAAAAAYWQDRIRLHIGDVYGKGRFATESQREEAVDYLQEGIAMFAQMQGHVDSARSRNETWQQFRDRVINVVRRFGGDEVSKDVVRNLEAAKKRKELFDALEPLVALQVSVNPESRVKVSASRSKFVLRQGRPQRFLVEVDNMAGITAPLNLSSIDVAMSPPGPANWCGIEIVDSPFTSRFLTGAKREYKVLQVTPNIAGLREVRIAGDAGQGTQDLGFRATTDVLLDVESKGIRK